MKNKKQFFIYTLLLIAGIIIGWLIFGGKKEPAQQLSAGNKNEKKITVWTCSMHPQIRQDKPGKCPICAMDLIPLNTSEDESDEFGKIQMSENAMKIADVQTSIVQKSVQEKEIRLPGKVKPDERKIAAITSRFAGRIEKLFVNFTGQQVRKGEKLAIIYSPDLITAQKELFEAIKLKQTNPEYYKAARNKLKLWSLSENQINNIEQTGNPENYFDVLAPLDGTVMKRQVALGDYVEMGTPLFEIADLSSVWVLLDAYESDLPWIRKGDNVNFEVQSLPGKFFSGNVTFIDPMVNSENRVAYIRTETSNPGGTLKPEMFVRGVIKTKLPYTENALVVPKSSVLWTGKKAVVYVKDKSKSKPTFEYREIVLGEDAGNFYVVKGGLLEGEEIITNGVFKVDAAAQLAGKKSMMNQEKGQKPRGHEGMDMPGTKTQDKNMEGMNIPEKSAASKDVNENFLSFKVYGNCDLCKVRIEKAAKSVKGILSADWNKDTKIIQVSAEKGLSAKEINRAIAKVGHDTQYERADQNAYNNLPVCCQYKREKN